MLTARAGGAIEMRRLTKIYGAERVVDGFEARIAAGEFFSLLGPSGSGKTTTLMMVAGFAAIDEGELIVDGRDLSAVPPEKRGFGMVFQSYAIFPHLDVFENVAFPLRARGAPKERVKERVRWALDLVQLSHLATRHSRQLSGGQQQRVAIARAIVFEPSIVLMDEPLGALDKNLRYDMQVEIKEIQQRLGMTVIYVTHDQEEAMNLSDRIAILNRGRIEQMGAPRDIYEHPANAFTARFLGEANLLRGTVLEGGAGGTYFRVEGGEVLIARPQDKVEGGLAAQLFVRPEKLALSAPHGEAVQAGRNRLIGRVRRVSFLGSMVRYAVELASGASLMVDAPNLSGGLPPAVGDEVAATWPAADSSIVEADAS